MSSSKAKAVAQAVVLGHDIHGCNGPWTLRCSDGATRRVAWFARMMEPAGLRSRQRLVGRRKGGWLGQANVQGKIRMKGEMYLTLPLFAYIPDGSCKLSRQRSLVRQVHRLKYCNSTCLFGVVVARPREPDPWTEDLGSTLGRGQRGNL